MSAVVGTTSTLLQAASIIADLETAGFAEDEISVVLPDESGAREFAHDVSSKAPEGAAAGAGTGGILGGAMGFLAGIGAVAIPGLGLLIAAGPIMGALSGAAAGAAVGGLAGGLVGYGIPEFEAKLYDGKVRSGSVLLAVHVDDSGEETQAKEIFTAGGAENLSTVSEKSR
jgi:hypothetical protein